jgi:hypothetical protein
MSYYRQTGAFPPLLASYTPECQHAFRLPVSPSFNPPAAGRCYSNFDWLLLGGSALFLARMLGPVTVRTDTLISMKSYSVPLSTSRDSISVFADMSYLPVSSKIITALGVFYRRNNRATEFASSRPDPRPRLYLVEAIYLRLG